MNLTFVHDFPVEYYPAENEYYSSGFNYDLWKRYLEVFKEINVISRYKEINNKKGKIISSGPGVNFHPVKEYQSFSSLIKQRRKISDEIELILEKSDAVLIRLPSILGFIAARICKKLDKKYAVEVVGSIKESYLYKGGLGGKLLAYPFDFLQKKGVRNSEISIYVTNKYLQKMYPTNGIVYSGISDVYMETAKKYSSSKNINFHNKIKIGIVGSTYTAYKGHDIALKALKKLVSENPSYNLEIVGQGLSPKVKKQINSYKLNENVTFKGVIYGKDNLNEWYSSLDFYIQPSKTEGQCRSIIEAIDNGIPTVSSVVGGNLDSVDKSFTFSPNDWKSLASLIEEMTVNKKLRDENIIRNSKKNEQFIYSKLREKRLKALEHYKSILKEN